jgi:hypothetical protein
MREPQVTSAAKLRRVTSSVKRLSERAESQWRAFKSFLHLSDRALNCWRIRHHHHHRQSSRQTRGMQGGGTHADLQGEHQ